MNRKNLRSELKKWESEVMFWEGISFVHGGSAASINTVILRFFSGYLWDFAWLSFFLTDGVRWIERERERWILACSTASSIFIPLLGYF